MAVNRLTMPARSNAMSSPMRPAVIFMPFGEGSALAGHHDRTGGGPNPTSWNSAHGSRGCSQENLQGTGGNGFFYCFAGN